MENDLLIMVGIIFFLSFLFVVFPYGALLTLISNIKKIKERLDAIEDWIYKEED